MAREIEISFSPLIGPTIHAGETATVTVSFEAVSGASSYDVSVTNYSPTSAIYPAQVTSNSFTVKFTAPSIVTSSSYIAPSITVSCNVQGTTYTGTASWNFQIAPTQSQNSWTSAPPSGPLSYKVSQSGSVAAASRYGTVLYSSNNTSVVTVNSNGSLSAVGAGSAKVRVYVNATSSYTGLSQTINVSVTKNNGYITINPTSKVINNGETFKINASASASVSYSSSNHNAVSVDQNGNVTAIVQGVNVTITVTASETEMYYAASAYCSVTVRETVVIEPPTVVSSYNYTGGFIYPTITYPTPGSDSILTKGDDTNALNVGNYYISFILPPDGSQYHYVWEATSSRDPVLRAWSIVKKPIASPSLSGTFTYDGQSHTIGTVYDSTWVKIDTNNSTLTATNHQALDYDVTFELKDSANTRWSDGTLSYYKVLHWNIAQKVINTINWGTTSYTYDGQEHKLAPSAVASDLIPGDTCTFTVTPSQGITHVDESPITFTIGVISNINYKLGQSVVTSHMMTIVPDANTLHWDPNPLVIPAGEVSYSELTSKYGGTITIENPDPDAITVTQHEQFETIYQLRAHNKLGEVQIIARAPAEEEHGDYIGGIAYLNITVGELSNTVFIFEEGEPVPLKPYMWVNEAGGHYVPLIPFVRG